MISIARPMAAIIMTTTRILEVLVLSPQASALSGHGSTSSFHGSLARSVASLFRNLQCGFGRRLTRVLFPYNTELLSSSKSNGRVERTLDELEGIAVTSFEDDDVRQSLAPCTMLADGAGTMLVAERRGRWLRCHSANPLLRETNATKDQASKDAHALESPRPRLISLDDWQ
ncbi:hypothetical protein CYLTODRAFT_415025 [Cylindrobasidium torrendii FP15055 ss-10]|uniref:Secreted protein n=1 Tax=Cylindrobasidium torrendii FP15055 ss-10 TaxID=1314674 RepID=A0A0D7AUI2_9AGAR|nr:hypothetical protein CYLTODRAFT_415025 [Cylindrobasidium torrendii FP15055 ss-10]